MANQPREQWGSRAGFLMAAIGSAVGLGNIWRFPAEAYKNGGGAFLLPYLVALLTAGLPLLILEYSVGRRYRKSPPAAMREMSRPTQFIGWWQVAVCTVIGIYYAVIVAWAVRYTGFSFGSQWGEDAEAFFGGDFLQTSDSPGMPSEFVGGVFWPLLFVWVVILAIIALGVRKGIEKSNMVFIPALLVFFVALVVRAVTLDGAAEGLDALFRPDWGALTDGSVWVAAYGQIFFSLSIGFGIMITYASYLGRKADLSGSALVAGFANSSFEILAGIGVFATLGFMAQANGVGVGEVVSDGVGLAFIAFPTVISQMPLGTFFGVCFFVSLAIAGLTSLVSIVEVVISAVRDRTGMKRVPAVLIVGGAMALVSLLLFPTNQGLSLLDSADHFINQYGIVLAAFVFLIVVCWMLRGRLKAQQDDINATSAVPMGFLWRICLSVVTPVMLGWMLFDSLRGEFAENYGGYPDSFVAWAGWAVAGGALAIGILLSLIPWRRETAIGAGDESGAPAGDEPVAPTKEDR
ncbi:sodium-dependent transporter [Streptomyces sp. HNM0574]|uniref:sodium-dependent transporter n=1 Tax=Streptomyces sp. HNM0574 TaxID=2714954 RepID=UPI00146B11DC|nr:sodium-dependent transporter [Streptomyces sp. HNM0574]NLU67727.1 sodium-dependent transporter [Streptomyces sp. HNM0574]